MDAPPTFGLRELLTHIISGIAKALSGRAGETQPQHYTRSMAATHAVVAFAPSDAIEAMLASHCVMLHEMIVDDVQRTLRDEDDAHRRATRSSILAMDKAFGNNLTRLERYRARRTEGKPTAGSLAETEIADRIQRHQAQTPLSSQPASAPVVAGDNPPTGQIPAAIDPTDPARFARTKGADQPDQASLAATASQIAGSNQAHSPGPSAHPSGGATAPYAGNHQARPPPNR